MKKNIADYNFLIMCLLVIIISFLLSGCGTVKTKHFTDRKETQKEVDSIFITKTLAVNDTIRVEVPVYRTAQPECDSLLNAKLRETLTRLNTIKNSGANSYGFFFDKYKDQLVAFAKLEQQISELRNKLTEKNTDNNEYKEVPKAYIPKFYKYASILGVISGIAFIIFIALKLKSKFI